MDYSGIGKRIKNYREKLKMTQQMLGEETDYSVQHISHIETGNSIPSLQVVINIINALNCSADELLFMDVQKASPEINGWLTELVADCSQEERKLISDMVIALKASLRRLKTFEP